MPETKQQKVADDVFNWQEEAEGMIYDVYIGKNSTKEIDFVGVRREDRIYVQVCVELPAESTRETDNLMKIKDHYHIYVVCRDPLAIGNNNGIEIVHIADFLLRENW